MPGHPIEPGGAEAPATIHEAPGTGPFDMQDGELNARDAMYAGDLGVRLRQVLTGGAAGAISISASPTPNPNGLSPAEASTRGKGEQTPPAG